MHGPGAVTQTKRKVKGLLRLRAHEASLSPTLTAIAIERCVRGVTADQTADYRGESVDGTAGTARTKVTP